MEEDNVFLKQENLVEEDNVFLKHLRVCNLYLANPPVKIRETRCQCLDIEFTKVYNNGENIYMFPGNLPKFNKILQHQIYVFLIDTTRIIPKEYKGMILDCYFCLKVFIKRKSGNPAACLLEVTDKFIETLNNQAGDIILDEYVYKIVAPGSQTKGIR